MKRDVFTMTLPLGHELAIDNFAGGGGASTGIAAGLGREVDIAINHNGEALAMHAANHPTAAHHNEDVFNIHPGFVTRQLPIGLAWFSPDCKHFSKAKGSKPVDKKIRGLAWVALRWATFQAPRVLMLENVEEFQDWGPLGPDNQPIPTEKGRTFRAFVAALSTGLSPDHPDLEEIYTVLGHDFPIARLYEGLGYQVDWRVLRACDYGTPTIRKRLFLIARRDGLPLVWPQPTHGDPKSDAVRRGHLLPWRGAVECIDWTIAATSIFERSRPLKEATLRRIAKGLMKFTAVSGDPFIAGAGGPVYSGKPRSVNDPMNTLLQESHSNIVMPVLMPLDRGDTDGGAVASAKYGVVNGSGDHHARIIALLQNHADSDAFADLLARPGIVTLNGRDYAIVDIGMRPLTPRELATAQGFGPDYKLDPVVNGKPLSKASQVRMIGNSVCPPIAKALVEANFRHEHALSRAA